MPLDPAKPFNELPLLPPAQDIESKVILKQAIGANRMLAELKQKAHSLPNQMVLINSLVLLEAKDSSEIENIFTTHDKLYQADVMRDGVTDSSTKEVMRYRSALFAGVKAIQKRPLGTNVFVSICQRIKLTNEGIRNTSGTRIVTPTGKLIYTPPEGEELLRRLLKNLEEFMHKEDGVNSLIKMAVMHYQFEAIHPFTDGNGRTGRIANILYLLEKGYLETPVLFLSRYIIENKNPYYLGLKNVTEKGAWEPWIVYMLEAVEQTAAQTIKRIEAIKQAMDRFSETLKEKGKKIYSKDLVEAAFTTPYFQVQSVTQSLGVSRQTAAKYLLKLEKLGLITKKKVGRDVIYTNPSFTRALKN